MSGRVRFGARRFLVASVVIAASALNLGHSGVSAVGSTVTGRVFQDFNSDATLDTAVAQGVAVDVGVAGVTVRAYDSTGAKVGETTSGADGTYSLTVSGAASSSVRIEFSWSDSGATAGMQPSFNGAGSATTVQFVNVGASGVDLGVNVPGDYCQNNPDLVTCYMGMGAGTSNAKTGAQVFSSAMPTIKSSDYSTTNFVSNSYTGIANSDKLGAVFGIGVDRSRNVFLGTYVKRHIDYGDAGATNAIYRVNRDNPGVVTTFVTLPGALPAHSSADIGSCCVANAYTDDKAIVSQVGRKGLGDVDVTPDGRTLLAVDMEESAPKLYFVPINGAGDSVTAGTPTSVNITKPATFGGVDCVGNWHPMGIGVRGRRILVGGVCGAESTVTGAKRHGDDVTKAAAFVLEYSAGSFTTLLAFSLGYDRDCTVVDYTAGWSGSGFVCDPNNSDANTLIGGDWGAWNEYPSLYDRGTLDLSGPQPMLANIEIADNGDLVLGVRDRSSDQFKYNSAAYTYTFDDGSNKGEFVKSADGTTGTFTYGNKAVYNYSSGDLLRVCRNGSTLAIETTGTCPNSVGAESTNSNGTKEFYFDGLTRGYHTETTLGSTALMPGYQGVWSTMFDPTNYNQQGVGSFGPCAAALTPADCNPNTLAAGNIGTKIGGQIFDDVAGFAKGDGMSDLEVMCDQAPVQIGNRVWIDYDRDGIQDPEEVPVAGATVRLYSADGSTLLGTAVTNANGEYYFDSTVSEAAAGTGDNVGGGLVAGSAYVIRLDKASDYTNGGPLYGYVLTSTAASDPVTALDSSVDSNAATVSSYPQVAVATVDPGFNNHTYDVGFYDPLVAPPTTSTTTTVPTTPVGIGNYVWIDADKDGVKDASEKSIAGVVVTLYNPDGTPATTIDGSPASATTDANGYYFIDNLAPGSYYAKFTLPAGYKFTKQAPSGSTSSNDSNADPVSGQTAVFTIGAATGNGTQVDANQKTKASFVQVTIAAGVVPQGTVSVGNFVWRDLNGDGVQGPNDPGVKGVILRLYNTDGSPVVDALGRSVKAIKTGSDGRFLFSNLLPGQYVVKAVYPSGWFPTTNERSGREKNSSAFRAVSRTLAAGGSDLSLDFGMVYRSVRRLPATR